MFHASIVVAADRCCGRMVVSACCGVNTRTCWGTLVGRDAVRLKESYSGLFGLWGYVSLLAWERLGIPPEELDEVAGRGKAAAPATQPRTSGGEWMD